MRPKKWSKAQSNRVKPQPQTPLAEPLGPGWSHLAFCGKSFTSTEKKISRMAPPWGQWNRPWQGKTSRSRCDVKMSSGPSVKKALDWVRRYNQTQMKRIAKLVGLVWHLTQTRRLNIPDLSGFRWISWQASKNCKWPAIREYWEYTIAIDRFKGSRIQVSSMACLLSFGSPRSLDLTKTHPGEADDHHEFFQAPNPWRASWPPGPPNSH